MSNELKIQTRKEKPLLLFSCLDWGLGHTTRSIPLLRELQTLGCDLIVACNSIQKNLLKPEFPSITFVDIPGYGVVYGNAKWRTKVEILFQLRKILTKINAESQWLRRFLKENRVDGLISDNRYGLFQPALPAVLITHQLGIKSGYGSVPDRIAQKFLYRFINRFSECWVPDVRSDQGLAGELSRPAKMPRVPVKYLGAVSRFEICRDVKPPAFRYKVLAIISGPEPQRSIFEKLVIDQLNELNISSALVRGLPGETLAEVSLSSQVTVFNHLDSTTLNKLICDSEYVVCRSGYTSMMDLLKLKKQIIVVPTPGQPEQEYLATWLSKQRYVIAASQNKFSLIKSISAADSFAFNEFNEDMNAYKDVLKNFVNKISSLSPSSKY